MMITILVVDHNDDARSVVSQTLSSEGYSVIEAKSAAFALSLAQKHRPDAIILDTGLVDMSGFDLCAQLRSMPFVERAPILFLSAQPNAQHIAQALDCGGDDYLRKPFAARELNARIRALLRRSSRAQAASTETLYMDAATQTVTINRRRIELTPTEFSLLEHLAQHPANPKTAAQLLETVWQYPTGSGDTALVRNHIRNLRRKIEKDPDHPQIILSLHGRGYVIKARLMYV